MSSTASNLGGSFKGTAWSDWTWNAGYNCEYRYRQDAAGEWEYEYGPVVEADESTPRNGLLNAYQLDPIQETTQPEYLSSQTYSSSPNYQDDSVNTLTQQLSGTSLNYSQDPQVKGKRIDSNNSIPNYPSQNIASWRPNNAPRKIFTRSPKTKVDFDPNFKEHRSKEFKFGRIFKVLWSEPSGSGGTEITERTSVKTKFGEKAYHSIRRFVIVDDSKKGHCICLPILTYGGQGTLKHGVHPEDHALIYTQQKNHKGPPSLLKHEYPLTKKPIRVEPISPSHKLDPASRLNYAKLYTVEHNVKVFFVGWVAKEHEHRIADDYNNRQRPLPSRPKILSHDYEGREEPELIKGSMEAYNSRNLEDADIFQESSLDLDAAESQNIDSLSSTTMVHFQDSKGLADEGVNTNQELLSPSSSAASFAYSSLSSLVMSQSSMTSIAQPGACDRLVDFLYSDKELYCLYNDTLQKSTYDGFEAHFRSFLLQLAAQLRLEATSREEKETAKIIQTFSRNAAHTIRNMLQTKRGITKIADRNSNEPDLDWDADDAREEDELIPIDEIHGENDQLQLLDQFVRASESFKLLKEAFQLLIQPDPIKNALFKAWPVTWSRGSTYEIAYEIEWELPQFLERNFDEEQVIDNVLTLTGDSFNAQALSCKEYLAFRWSGIGSLILEGLRCHLHNKSEVSVQNEEAKVDIKQKLDLISDLIDQTDSKSDKSSKLFVTATATHSVHAQIIDCLSWISASFRNSKQLDVMYSSAIIETKKIKAGCYTVVVKSGSLESAPPSKACWRSLFPYGVIAKGFPIRPRLEGKGLEISFANMALISRCLSFVEYENGLIAHGLTSILIPMNELPQDDALQWHLEDKTKQDLQRQRLARISQILRLHIIRDWYKELDPNQLVNRRSFLGWAENAKVVFGTKDYHPQFEWSEAPRSPTKNHVTSYGFTFGYSILGIQAQGTMTRIPIAAKSAIQSAQEQDVYDALAKGQDHHVLVYDNSKKLGHYLPQVSVALQLAHSRIAKCGYRLYKGELAIGEDESFMFANPGADGNAEACLAVRACCKLTVWKDQTEENSAKESFIEFFRKSWHILTDIAENLDSADTDFQMVGDVAPKYIHGVELIDAMNMESSLKIKRVKIDQPWGHLTSEQPAVLLSKNLPPAIICESQHLCKSWTNVPTDKNYLVTTGLIVQSLLEHQSEGLGQRLDWVGGTPLIESHKQGRHAPIFHSQKLRTKKKPHPNASIRNQIKGLLDSAFVFGDGSEKKCREKIELISFDSPPEQRPSVHDHINKSLASIHSSASDTSVNDEDVSAPDSLGDENSSFVREHGLFWASTFFMTEPPPAEFRPEIPRDSTIQEPPFKRLRPSSFSSRVSADEIGIFEPRPPPIEPSSRKISRYSSTSLNGCLNSATTESMTTAVCRSDFAQMTLLTLSSASGSVENRKASGLQWKGKEKEKKQNRGDYEMENIYEL